MAHDPVQAVLSRLPNVQTTGERKWSAQCPCHDDNKNSLCVSIGDDGRVLMHDQAGCATETVLSSIGLKMADLFPQTNGHGGNNGNVNGSAKKRKKIAAVYHYADESGAVLYDVVRFDPKDFRQGRPKPDGKGGWVWSVNGTRRVIYRLPTVSKADPSKPVWIVEGEKDVETLERLGLLATTNAGGAGKWLADYSESLRGRRVIILSDNDDPGRKHVQHVASSLHGIAQRIRAVELPGMPPKGDVTDWFASGGTLENLNAIVKATPDWQPSKVATAPTDVADADAEHLPQFRGGQAVGDEMDPSLIADEFIKSRRRHVFYTGSFYDWEITSYLRLADHDFRAIATDFFDRYRKEVNDRRLKEGSAREDGKIPLVTFQSRIVSDVIECLKAKCLRKIGANVSTTFWLDGKPHSPNYVSMQNGIVDLDRVMAGERDVLEPHTNQFFTVVSLPYSYDPAAECPTWKEFLDRNFEGDSQRIRILQEFAGLCLIPADTSEQKFLVLHGDGSNGKSCVCAALTAVLGPENCSAVPLESFGQRFQLTQTLGKLANIVEEIGELDRAAEAVLKAYTSGARMSWEDKGKAPFTAAPTARLILATNTLPRFSDRSEGVWRRCIAMPMRVRIAESGRVRGMDKPGFWMKEGAGIFNWAVEGHKRLRSQRSFSVSDACTRSLASYKTECNPARQFLTESYREHESGIIDCGNAYDKYCDWCAKNGHRPLANSQFGKEVIRAFGHAERRRSGPKSARRWSYFGICEGGRLPEDADSVAQAAQTGESPGTPENVENTEDLWAVS
jgi:putative DNA primase/helicase